MQDKIMPQKQPIVPSSFSSFIQVHHLQREREDGQQQTKIYPTKRIFIAPIHQTRPLALDYSKGKKGEQTKIQCLPNFQKFDLPSIFSNKPITTAQFLIKHSQGESQKNYQTPQREKNLNQDNLSGSKRYDHLNTTIATVKNFKRLSVIKKSRPKEKGLRQLSHRAYQIVLNMKTATYKEVANKLVVELNNEKQLDPEGKDELNIKRRVYDALNVLIALGVLRKEGRRIVGDRERTLFFYQREAKLLSRQVAQKQSSLLAKLRQKQKLQLKKIVLKQLIESNQTRIKPLDVIQLPFVVLRNEAKEDTNVEKNSNDQIVKITMKWEKSENDIIKSDTQLLSQFYSYCKKMNE